MFCMFFKLIMMLMIHFIYIALGIEAKQLSKQKKKYIVTKYYNKIQSRYKNKAKRQEMVIKVVTSKTLNVSITQ